MDEKTDQQNLLPTAIADLESLPRDQAEKLRKVLAGIAESMINQSLPRLVEEKLSLLREQALEKIGYTEEVAGLVQLLAAKSNDSKDEVLRKALTLYGLALDAREKGNRIAILSPDDVILHEVVGFDSMNEPHPTSAV